MFNSPIRITLSETVQERCMKCMLCDIFNNMFFRVCVLSMRSKLTSYGCVIGKEESAFDLRFVCLVR